MKILAMNMTTTDGVTTITAVGMDKGERRVVAITEGAPHFDEALAKVEEYTRGELDAETLGDWLVDTIDVGQRVAKKVSRVTGILDGRMSFDGSHVLIDHEPIDPVLDAHVMRLLDESGTPKDMMNWKAFARFVENLYSNVNEHVREQLFGWLNYENLKGHGFSLTPDGCFIGYKGCAVDSEGTPVSVHHGPAIVDGVHMNGAIPNKVGSIVEMPRKNVQFDPSVGCSSGLHVGTYAYASDWAKGILLRVKVNPRDVVSVPTECNAQKIRTCRYEVLEVTEVPYTGATYGDGDDDWDDDFDSQPEDEKDTDLRQFRYRKSNGEVKDYEVEVTDETSTHLYGILADSKEHRTFVKKNILPFAADQLKAGSDKGTTAPDTPKKETGVFNLPVGSRVKITYRKKDGVVNDYTVEVTGGTSTLVDTVLVGVYCDKYRTFTRANIISWEHIGGPTEDSNDSKAGNAERPLTGRVRVVLKNGVSHTGEILSTTERYVILRTDNGIKLVLPHYTIQNTMTI